VTTIHKGLDVNLGGVGSGSTDKTQAAQGQPSQVSGQPQAAPAAASGDVAITHAAQLMARLEQQISSLPEVNQSRVDSIRQALNNGSYKVDASKIADGLLAAQKLDAQAATGSASGPQASTVKAFAATAQLGTGKS
jgi:negative regulator of flagellin synthesis FlgM